MIMFPVVFESSRPGRLSFETTETADSSRARGRARDAHSEPSRDPSAVHERFFVFSPTTLVADRLGRDRLGREAAISSEELLNFRST